MGERKSLWKLILMLTACVSQQPKACYTQIATCTTVELCSDVSTGSTGESEQKTVGVTQRMDYLDYGEFRPEVPGLSFQNT